MEKEQSKENREAALIRGRGQKGRRLLWGVIKGQIPVRRCPLQLEGRRGTAQTRHNKYGKSNKGEQD